MTRRQLGPHPTPKNPMGEASGARWCDDHGRWECTRNRTKGRGQCHQAATGGTDSCKTHSGKSLEVAKAEGQARIQAHKAITAWSAEHGTPDIDHNMAVLRMLQMAWVRSHVYAELVRQQVAAEGMQVHPEQQDPDSRVETSGLIGHEYGAAGKDGRIFAKSEQVRALVRLESEERDRVVRYAKTAHDMGISDRLASLAERWGDLVAGGITSLLADLDLSPEQTAKVPALVTRHLAVIEVTGGLPS